MDALKNAGRTLTRTFSSSHLTKAQTDSTQSLIPLYRQGLDWKRTQPAKALECFKQSVVTAEPDAESALKELADILCEDINKKYRSKYFSMLVKAAFDLKHVGAAKIIIKNYRATAQDGVNFGPRGLLGPEIKMLEEIISRRLDLTFETIASETERATSSSENQ